MSKPVSVVVKLAPDVYMIWAARADAHRTQVHVLLADAATRSARAGLLRHPKGKSPRRAYVRVTPELEQRMRELYAQNATASEAAAELGMSYANVRKHFKRWEAEQ